MRGANEAPPRRGLARLAGVWRSHGYGTVLEVGAERYALHEETRVSCLRVFEGTLAELGEHYVDVRISPGGQAFSARRATGVTRIKYRRLKGLPPRCAAVDEVLRGDPVINYEVFWHTFAERYALFGIRDVDWQAVHDEHRARVDARTGRERLFATFVEMLRPLRDGHVELRAPFRRFSAGPPPRLVERLAREFGVGPHDEPAWTALAELRAGLRATLVERYLGATARRSCHGLLEWGRLNATTGYLGIRAMAGQSGRLDRPREDQAAVAAALDRVLGELGDLPALVLDVRENGGGYDGVALRIAGRFTDRKRLAFTKAPGKHEGHGAEQRVLVEPRGRKRYKGRVHLLTSGLTASAAEVFVLALLQHPRLTRLGEPTRGELSDVMERHLPNGWSLSLSNELYRASDGELYEDRGIPPDVPVRFPTRADVESGRDPALDRVLLASARP